MYKREKESTGNTGAGGDRIFVYCGWFKNNASWSEKDALWLPLALNLSITKGSWVETGERSYAALNGSLGDMVALGERTKLRLDITELSQYAGIPLTRGIRFIKGMARFVIAKNKGGFIVETPSAKIKVKGTIFSIVYMEETKSTDVRVEEGTVDIEDLKVPGRNFTLSQHQLH